MTAVEQVQVELAYARAHFPKFHSAHEGYAVMTGSHWTVR
jgi:hypothetical protein